MRSNDFSNELARRMGSPFSSGNPTFPPTARQSAPIFTWEQVVRILSKNMRFAVFFFVAMTAAVTIVAFKIQDYYQSTARLEIEPPSGGIRTLPEIEDSRLPDNEDYLETQAQILQSDALAVSVIRMLHLDRNPEFVSEREQSRYGNAQSPTKPNGTEGSGDTAFMREQFDLANRTPLESVALGKLQHGISVMPMRNSRLIEVSFTGKDPALSQLITNTLVTQFIEQTFRNRYTTTMQASGWLSSQLDDLRRKVEASNQSVADYQKKYNLVDTDEHDNPFLAYMAEVNHQLSDAQADRIEGEAYVRMIDTGQGDTVPAVRDDQLYQNLMSHLADVRAQLAQVRTTYGDESSNVKKLEGETQEFATQVEAERTRMSNRVRNSLTVARDREHMILEEREKLTAQMGDANSHQVAYRLLKNEAAANVELYNTLQSRLKEAGIYAGLRSSDVQIVDLAGMPRSPAGPRRQLIIAIGAMVSGLLALVFTFVRDSFDNTVRTPDDTMEWTGLPSLAIFPRIETGATQRSGRLPSAAYAALPGSSSDASTSKVLDLHWNSLHAAAAEAVNDLRTALQFSKPGAPPRTILITSSMPGEGKTTIAINLAKVYAQSGRVCLIEGDLREPMLAKVFGLRTNVGLTHVLTGAVPLDSALSTAPGFPDLAILPAGPFSPNPADLIASDQMLELMTTLKNSFDYVVIDSPPIIPLSDARVLATFVDVVVVVSCYGLTTRRAATRCLQLLDEVHAPVVGCVLNRMDLGSADYHYYNYGYSRKMNGDLRYYSSPKLGPIDPPKPGPEKAKGAHA
jgi:capsular exopolysaccharide synthesis family protein